MTIPIVILIATLSFFLGRLYEFFKNGSLFHKINMVRDYQEKLGINPAKEIQFITDKEYLKIHNDIFIISDLYLIACKNRNKEDIAKYSTELMHYSIHISLKHGLGHKLNDLFDEVNKANINSTEPNIRKVLEE